MTPEVLKMLIEFEHGQRRVRATGRPSPVPIKRVIYLLLDFTITVSKIKYQICRIGVKQFKQTM